MIEGGRGGGASRRGRARAADPEVVPRERGVETTGADGVDRGGIGASHALEGVRELPARPARRAVMFVVVTPVAEHRLVEIRHVRAREQPKRVIVVGMDAIGRASNGPAVSSASRATSADW